MSSPRSSNANVRRPFIAAALVTAACVSRDEDLPPCPSALPLSSSEVVTVAAVGDLGDCSNGASRSVAEAIEGVHPDAFLPLGDLVYPDGSLSEFLDCYGPRFGRFRDITRPVPGNHEYHTPHAAPYYGYFCRAAGDPFVGYHSFELGRWHVVVLNSNCGNDLDLACDMPDDFGGCGADSPQAKWLRADLAEHSHQCKLALFHHPLESQSVEGDSPHMGELVSILRESRVDLILNGHAHNYQRFSKDGLGGIRSIVVGTGGTSLDAFEAGASRSEARDDQTHGFLRLELRPSSYSFNFISVEDGRFSDQGEGTCEG